MSGYENLIFMPIGLVFGILLHRIWDLSKRVAELEKKL